MIQYHTELVCDDCPYEVAVGNAGRAAFERLSPDACPRCEGDLRQPTGNAEVIRGP